jgi:hypothetical protein
MTAQTTRILKEARPLIWPWCAVALAGALPLVYSMSWMPLMYLIGFFVIPVMATLSLGDEFQHRTLSLLLSQPVGRMRIWGEKLSVTVLAIVSTVLLFSLALRATAFRPDRQALTFATAWVVAIIASATFWTLFTRSSVGGVAVNIVVQSILILMVPWTSLADWLRARGYLSPLNTIVVPIVAIVGYAGVMLWLSWRSLARFQVTGGMGCDDLLTAGPEVMPGALADWLRCRPTGALLNLIRKELRLLRPLWLISLLAAVGWACLTLFGLLYERGYSRNFETAVVIVGVVSTLMIAILAGSLSLGEERTSGTHAWNLTLPVSARRQWCVKLFVALFAGFVGAGLLPMLTVGRLHMLFDLSLGTRWLVVVLLLTFAAFWCACAVDGTVAAALWVIPVTIVLGGASYLAERWAYDLEQSFWGYGPLGKHRSDWLVTHVAHRPDQALNLLGNLRFDWWVAHVTYRHLHVLGLVENSMFYAGLVGVPALILALVQSYRLFGARNRGNSRSVMRNLLPLALLVFLCGFSWTALDAFWWRVGSQASFLTAVTSHAIEKALPGAAKLHPTEPLQLTGEDVAKAWRWPVEESARRWLRGARITVTPDKAHPGSFFCTPDPWGNTQCYFSATIHLADGTDIFESYDPPTDGKFYFGRSSIRVRWPGATGEETLWDR